METVNSSGPAAPCVIPYAGPVRTARLLGRRARFLMDLEDASGRFTAHTNNTGTMLGLLRPGARVLLSESTNPNRKLKHTLELVVFHGTWVGVNTSTPQKLLRAAWSAGALPEAAGYAGFRPEATRGDSRLDALLEGPQGRLWVECKNVTLVEDGSVALFPDAVTTRGLKHLHELADIAKSGERAALFLLVQRADASCLAPATLIDPDWAKGFYAALDKGVEAWAYRAVVTPEGIGLGPRLPVLRP